ncbi:MAG: hypothetical protein K9G70_00555 [Prolixibacteraceae bacterium]|nr:hypothetical protein [Prolixibacteraceae bacterium]
MPNIKDIGWKMQDEKRGGHINGAKTLPAKWAGYIDWIEIVGHKQILPDDEIIIYGYTSEESEKVAQLFKKAGYDNISLYHNFLTEWVADDSLPMDKLHN